MVTSRTRSSPAGARAYDPAVADVFIAEGAMWLAGLDGLDPWDAVLDAEPDPVLEVDPARLDDVLAAFADFTDLKSPWFLGHSRGVAELPPPRSRRGVVGAADRRARARMRSPR